MIGNTSQKNDSVDKKKIKEIIQNIKEPSCIKVVLFLFALDNENNDFNYIRNKLLFWIYVIQLT